jgi:hypothetical protein
VTSANPAAAALKTRVLTAHGHPPIPGRRDDHGAFFMAVSGQIRMAANKSLPRWRWSNLALLAHHDSAQTEQRLISVA